MCEQLSANYGKNSPLFSLFLFCLFISSGFCWIMYTMHDVLLYNLNYSCLPPFYPLLFYPPICSAVGMLIRP